MGIKPDVVYRVTKGNTDGCVEIGDILVLDGEDSSLNIFITGGGWLDKEELTPEIMDFEAEEATDYEYFKDRWRIGVRKKHD